MTVAERDAAIGDLDEALRRQPETSPQAANDQVSRGRLLFANRRNQDVLAACDAALKIVPDHPEAHALRIAALLDLKRYDEVLRSCEAYLARGKPTVGVLEVRGLAHVARKDYVAAIGDFTQAIEIRPDPEPNVRTRLYNQRGWAYHFADAPRLALADFEKSLVLTPDQSDALGGRGLARIRLGLWQPALQDADAAVRLAGRVLPHPTRIARHSPRRSSTPRASTPRPSSTPPGRSAARARKPSSSTAVTAPAPSTCSSTPSSRSPTRPAASRS